MYDIAIIGGGLAGLTNAVLLAKKGLSVVLFEKKEYPFHRVCGEYISNEVRPFLCRNDLFPEELVPSEISKFVLSSTNGRRSEIALEMGGFGISRYRFDHFLYEQALTAGVEIKMNSSVGQIRFEESHFAITSGRDHFEAKIVIGAHGKRSKLDTNLQRAFVSNRSPYIGVKYHIKTDHPADTIALHNFQDGYCGISRVEQDTYNLCYLSHRNNLKKYSNISDMERAVLFQNPILKEIFNNSDFVFDNPLVINEISFEKKRPVENHVLMCGDAAGTIVPLSGNGMSMAFHSANILSNIIFQNWSNGKPHRDQIEKLYTDSWDAQFGFRLWAGRKIQGLFGSPLMSNLAVSLTKINPLAKYLVRMTHGKEF